MESGLKAIPINGGFGVALYVAKNSFGVGLFAGETGLDRDNGVIFVGHTRRYLLSDRLELRRRENALLGLPGKLWRN